MRLRQYQGRSTNEVMKQIRQDLGPDALIVSTEEQNGRVRIVAAQDYISHVSLPQEGHVHLRNLLTYHKVPQYLIEQISSQIKSSQGSPEADLKHALQVMAKTSSLDHIMKSNRPLMLIGPPGVGKTLVTAKLAAQAKFYDEAVNVISTDRQKSGAYEQIEQLMKTLEVPLRSIQNPHILHKTLQDETNPGLKIIDTAGISPYEQSDRASLKEYIESTKPVVILVMRASGDHEHFNELEDAFETFKPEHVILTQLDLHARLGHVITRCIESQFPVLAVGKHQQVAQFLIPTLSDNFIQLFSTNGRRA